MNTRNVLTVVMYTVTTMVAICLFIAALVDLCSPDVNVDEHIETIASENDISLELLERLSRLEHSTGNRFDDIHANVDTLLIMSAVMMICACVVDLASTLHFACTQDVKETSSTQGQTPIKLDTLNPILTVLVSAVIVTRAHMATYDRNLQLAFLFISLMVIMLTKAELRWSVDWIVNHKKDDGKSTTERMLVYVSSMLKGMTIGFEVLLFFSALVAYGARVAIVFNGSDDSLYTNGRSRSDDLKLLFGDFKLSLALVLVYSITCWLCPRKALAALVSHANKAGLTMPCAVTDRKEKNKNRIQYNHSKSNHLPADLNPEFETMFVYYLTTLPLKLLATVWVIGYYNEWFDIVPSYVNDMVPSCKTSGHDTYIAIAIAVCVLDLAVTMAICVCVLIQTMKATTLHLTAPKQI